MGEAFGLHDVKAVPPNTLNDQCPLQAQAWGGSLSFPLLASADTK